MTLGSDREEIVEIKGNAGLAGLSAFDHAGNRLNSDVREDESAEDLYRIFVNVPSIPAFGYTTIYLKPKEKEETIVLLEADECGQTWETGYYLLEFNAAGRNYALAGQRCESRAAITRHESERASVI